MTTKKTDYSKAKALWEEYKQDQQKISSIHQATDFGSWLAEKQLTTSQRQDKYTELYFKTLRRLERAEAENSALRHRMEQAHWNRREEDIHTERAIKDYTPGADGELGFRGRVLVIAVIGIFALGIAKLSEIIFLI